MRTVYRDVATVQARRIPVGGAAGVGYVLRRGYELPPLIRCFATLVLTSLPLSLAMLMMLRYAAPLRPTAVTLAGSLAVAAITATALSLLHDLDATVMILMWNLGTAALFVGLGGAFGGTMFSWAGPRSMTRDA